MIITLTPQPTPQENDVAIVKAFGSDCSEVLLDGEFWVTNEIEVPRRITFGGGTIRWRGGASSGYVLTSAGLVHDLLVVGSKSRPISGIKLTGTYREIGRNVSFYSMYGPELLNLEDAWHASINRVVAQECEAEVAVTCSRTNRSRLVDLSVNAGVFDTVLRVTRSDKMTIQNLNLEGLSSNVLMEFTSCYNCHVDPSVEKCTGEFIWLNKSLGISLEDCQRV